MKQAGGALWLLHHVLSLWVLCHGLCHDYLRLFALFPFPRSFGPYTPISVS